MTAVCDLCGDTIGNPCGDKECPRRPRQGSLTVVSFLWGAAYGMEHIEKLARGLKRNISQPHRTILITDNLDLIADAIMRRNHGFDEIAIIQDTELTKHKGCLARLRLFDPYMQAILSVLPGDRLACIDLDVVITGNLDPLFERPESFVILGGANSVNPCPVNGSLWMLRGCTNQQVWFDFSLEELAKIPFYEFPDDQGWLAHKMPGCATWQVGPSSGIWSFAKAGWPADNKLPRGARLVAFPGWRDPSKFRHLDWIERHWK